MSKRVFVTVILGVAACGDKQNSNSTASKPNPTQPTQAKPSLAITRTSVDWTSSVTLSFAPGDGASGTFSTDGLERIEQESDNGMVWAIPLAKLKPGKHTYKLQFKTRIGNVRETDWTFDNTRPLQVVAVDVAAEPRVLAELYDADTLQEVNVQLAPTPDRKLLLTLAGGKGGAITLGTTKHEFTGDQLQLTLDVGEELAKTELAFTPKLRRAFIIHSPGAADQTRELRISARSAFWGLLQVAPQKPWLLPGEDGAKRTKHAVMTAVDMGGDPSHFTSIDRFVVEERKVTRLPSCAYVPRGETDPVKIKAYTLFREQITRSHVLYDRISGKELARQSGTGNVSPCPKSLEDAVDAREGTLRYEPANVDLAKLIETGVNLP